MPSFSAFQSLVGFKINWNLVGVEDFLLVGYSFQSLVGFKINWNQVATAFQPPPRLFQSLVGFKINWN